MTVEANAAQIPEPAPEAPQPDPERLAGWLAHLGRAGRITHFGSSGSTVAAALGSAGARVTSHLGDAANSRAAERPAEMADVVVVEARRLQTVIPAEQAVRHLRAGGWLAVLGSPVVLDVAALIDAGTFRVDPEVGVRPCRLEPAATLLSLFRLASPAGRAQRRPRGEAQQTASSGKPSRPQPTGPARNGASALDAILETRRDRTSMEKELQQHASRVRALPVPPQTLIDWVGAGGPAAFEQVGRHVALTLMAYCRLRPTMKILEPGCGCGRNAKWFAPYLDAVHGAYEGFDIHRGAIQWATENITSHHPNVRFTFADIENTNYNPRGAVAPESYQFPYASGTFDVVFMPSVFTHMTDASFRHYLREIRRVLKPGGLLLSWHFLLDDAARRQVQNRASAIPFHPYDDVSWAQFPDNPCAAIAFDEEYVLRLYESLGLRAQRVIHGSWSGIESEGYPEFQDLVLATKHEG